MPFRSKRVAFQASENDLVRINVLSQDTLREDCDKTDNCERNCCVSPIIAPVFFVVFVLMAQFVLVNVVVAVLMKHLEVNRLLYQSQEKRWYPKNNSAAVVLINFRIC